MDKPEYNYDKLRGKIKEVCGTEGHFAEMLGRTQNYLTRFFQNKTFMSQKDIERTIDILGIEKQDIGTYFFAQRVHIL